MVQPSLDTKGEKPRHKRGRMIMKQSAVVESDANPLTKTTKADSSDLARDSYKSKLMNMMKQSYVYPIEEVDMDNGYYCIRFNLQLDYDYVLTNGPWIHYLIVRRWVPKFRFEDATIDVVAAWIQFSGMLLAYYDSHILRRMRNKIGKSVKIDQTTSNML
ncbi:hypothetical protein REPUB_Repub11eG0071200 [Reevesia pubescens]